ncbi:MAG: WbqC family protein [Candidatus Omnitrophica bacterium]|nr:WbqC family protein [Candidatus Omnitrophota bacterium]
MNNDVIVAIHQPQYLPWLGYIEKIKRSDVFILLDDVQFKKNEWQNRNRIRTSQGWQWLTVPILHNFGQSINEVVINNKISWRKDHLKALELNYKKAPYFDMYIGFFEGLYSSPWENLAELNIFIVRELARTLGIATKIVRSSEYDVTKDRIIRLIDLCRIFGSKKYLMGEGGEKYIDREKFDEAGIEIILQRYEHPVYDQLWQNADVREFIPNLSIADLLFNHGDGSSCIVDMRIEGRRI